MQRSPAGFNVGADQMITFDPETHRYLSDGVPVPGVNEVLDELGFGIDLPDALLPMLEHKAEVGTAVHKAIELDIQNDLDESSIPDLMGYVQAFRKWRAETDAKIEWTEKVLEGVGYCGRADIGATIGLESILLDIKTGSKIRVNRLKTAAYNAILGYQKRGCLYLAEDGEFDWDEHTEAEDYEIWKGLVKAFHWKKPRYSKGKKWI